MFDRRPVHLQQVKKRDTEPRIPVTRVHVASLRVPALQADQCRRRIVRMWQRMGAGT